jgi:hypothetical protein
MSEPKLMPAFSFYVDRLRGMTELAAQKLCQEPLTVDSGTGHTVYCVLPTAHRGSHVSLVSWVDQEPAG